MQGTLIFLFISFPYGVTAAPLFWAVLGQQYSTAMSATLGTALSAWSVFVVVVFAVFLEGEENIILQTLDCRP